MVRWFPTVPVSDFHNLIMFGLHLRDFGLFHAPQYHWQGFNVGMPFVLSFLFRILPSHNLDAVARLATAVVNGLIPLLPFFFWKNVLSLRVRLLAGGLLALWPGQVLFTGVVAQDNWVIFPSIGLAVLAVRALADPKRALPITAGLMYVAAVAIRADMLLLLPLLLAAARVDLIRTRWRTVAAGTVATAVGLVGLAAWRYSGSGRFSLATEFGGLAILGSYLPGASYSGWVAPYPYLASVRPDLLRDHQAMLTQTASLGWHEAFRRPRFHALRILSMMGYYAIDGESLDLYFALEAPTVLPPALHEGGVALAARMKEPLRIEMGLIQGLFMAVLVFGLYRRSPVILVLSAAVLMKLIFHAFGAYVGRYFLAATALEILTIAVGIEEALIAMRASPKLRLSPLVPALACGTAFALALFLLVPPMLASVQRRDFDTTQHVFEFSLKPPDKAADLNCTVHEGLLAGLNPETDATLRPLQPFDPAPGDRAMAECVLTGAGPSKPLVLRIFDPFPGGNQPGRMLQRVELDGEEVYSHDIAEEPGSGWSTIPLGDVGAGTHRKVLVEVRAVHPNPGADWSDNSRTQFLVARPDSSLHLAMGKRTSQSSSLSASESGGSSAAVDGNVDGDFKNGSVTATNEDPNAWWQVDLGRSTKIDSIVVWNRTDCCSSRLSDYWVFVSDDPFTSSDTPGTLCKRPRTWNNHQKTGPNPSTALHTGRIRGRYVRVQLDGKGYLSLAEVQVFGSPEARQ